MSRIGKQVIIIPEGVTVTITGRDVVVKGRKGELKLTIHHLATIKQKDGQLAVGRLNESKLAKSIHGLTRSLINNMVIGVKDGFEKKLRLEGTGYRVTKKGLGLSMTLGFSHPIEIPATEGVVFEVEGNKEIRVLGIDKELVGRAAANIRAFRPPEPYKGKGIRYSDEVVRRKPGKQAKAAGES